MNLRAFFAAIAFLASVLAASGVGWAATLPAGSVGTTNVLSGSLERGGSSSRLQASTSIATFSGLFSTCSDNRVNPEMSA